MAVLDAAGPMRRTIWSNAIAAIRGGTSAVLALRDRLPIVRGCVPDANEPLVLRREPASRVDLRRV